MAASRLQCLATGIVAAISGPQHGFPLISRDRPPLVTLRRKGYQGRSPWLVSSGTGHQCCPHCDQHASGADAVWL